MLLKTENSLILLKAQNAFFKAAFFVICRTGCEIVLEQSSQTHLAQHSTFKIYYPCSFFYFLPFFQNILENDFFVTTDPGTKLILPFLAGLLVQKLIITFLLYNFTGNIFYLKVF